MPSSASLTKSSTALISFFTPVPFIEPRAGSLERSGGGPRRPTVVLGVRRGAPPGLHPPRRIAPHTPPPPRPPPPPPPPRRHPPFPPAHLPPPRRPPAPGGWSALPPCLFPRISSSED